MVRRMVQWIYIASVAVGSYLRDALFEYYYGPLQEIFVLYKVIYSCTIYWKVGWGGGEGVVNENVKLPISRSKSKLVRGKMNEIPFGDGN